MRGVPRERLAISSAPSAVTGIAKQGGRAMEDAYELRGLVELQLRGEAEPVAQRSREQAGAGRGTDEGELGQLQRDGGGPWPLADDHVDPEVLHREVEHLLGRAGHPVDLVEEEHLALGQRGQDRGEVAGVLDRRAAGDPQRDAELVGHDHRERRLAEARRAGEQHVVGWAVAASGRLEDEAELSAYALLADALAQQPGT